MSETEAAEGSDGRGSGHLIGGNRDYLLLWSAGAVSALGTQMSGVAYPLVVLALTGSPALAGVVGSAALVAGLVCRLPAGALADHFDRRRAMILADVVRAAALGSVAIAAALGVLSVWQVVVAAVVERSFGELFRPASTAALRRVVRPEEMPAAVSRLEARSYAAGAAGPPLGGLLFGLAAFVPFAADAASYVYSIVSTLFVRSSMAVAPSPTPERIATRLASGLRWIWAERLIREMLVSAAGINAVFGALDLAVMVDARAHGATSPAIGVMLGIAGAAGFVGATLATRLAKSAHPSSVMLGIFWVTAALIPLMAVDAKPYVLGLLLGAATLLAPAANTILVSHVIVVTPDRLQGRVDAAGNFMTGALRPLAPLAAGLLLTAIGGPGTLLAIAVVMGAIALAVTASARMRSIPPVDQLSAG